MIITAENQSTLLALLQTAFPETSTTKLKKSIQYGCISYKNADVKHPEFVIQKGESIEYKKYIPKRSYREKASIPVLFEDEYILAVFKGNQTPLEGKNVHGRTSLLNAANAYLSKKRNRTTWLYIIHPLKSFEAGICLFAKTTEAQKEFKKYFRTYEKSYKAFIEGTMEPPKGKIEWDVLPPNEKTSDIKEKGTSAAIHTVSYYETLEVNPPFSLITIKTDSPIEDIVRIHFAEKGNPIVGDKKYGTNKHPMLPIKLFNYRLQGFHPFTKQKINIETTVPHSFYEEI